MLFFVAVHLFIQGMSLKSNKKNRLNAFQKLEPPKTYANRWWNKKNAGDIRFMTVRSTVYQQNEKCFCILAANPCADAFVVSVNPFHARHVQE